MYTAGDCRFRYSLSWAEYRSSSPSATNDKRSKMEYPKCCWIGEQIVIFRSSTKSYVRSSRCSNQVVANNTCQQRGGRAKLFSFKTFENIPTQLDEPTAVKQCSSFARPLQSFDALDIRKKLVILYRRANNAAQHLVDFNTCELLSCLVTSVDGLQSFIVNG